MTRKSNFQNTCMRMINLLDCFCKVHLQTLFTSVKLKCVPRTRRSNHFMFGATSPRPTTVIEKCWMKAVNSDVFWSFRFYFERVRRGTGNPSTADLPESQIGSSYYMIHTLESSAAFDSVIKSSESLAGTAVAFDFFQKISLLCLFSVLENKANKSA